MGCTRWVIGCPLLWYALLIYIDVETDSIFVFNALCRRLVQAGRLRRVLQEILELAFEFFPHCESCFVIMRLMGLLIR